MLKGCVREDHINHRCVDAGSLVYPHARTHTHTHTRTHTHTHIHTHTHTQKHTHTHTVPSGHILTKDELQVLHALLASYSSDRLKFLQLSLQEEQEIRDIPLEEVETSLRQSGLDTMADRLRNNLEKGILNEMMTVNSSILHTSLQ